MNEDTLNNLMQFFTATVSKATAGMATKEDIFSLEQKIDDGFAGIGDAIEQVKEHLQHL